MPVYSLTTIIDSNQTMHNGCRKLRTWFALYCVLKWRVSSQCIHIFHRHFNCIVWLIIPPQCQWATPRNMDKYIFYTARGQQDNKNVTTHPKPCRILWNIRYHFQYRKGQNNYQGIKLSSLLVEVFAYPAYKCGAWSLSVAAGMET